MIRNIIAEAIQVHLRDPRIPALTSVTRVDVSADMSFARVYVSVMLPEVTDAARRAKRQQLAVEALQAAAGHLRWMLGGELKLRKLPMLQFRLDESVQGSFETVQLIDRVMAETDAGEEDAACPEDEPGDEADAAEEGL
jgi:ribosome-binding factor A